MTRIALTIVLAMLTTCVVICEEAPDTSRYYSDIGNRTRNLLSTEFSLSAGSYLISEIEQKITRKHFIYFRHTLKASALIKGEITLEQNTTGFLGTFLQKIYGEYDLVPIVEFDGTLLVLQTSEVAEYKISEVPIDRNEEVPEPNANWRMKLSWALNGRVTLGDEDFCEPLSEIPWRFRYCPILAPGLNFDSIRIEKHYIHQPLMDILSDILTPCGLKYVPWCGVLRVMSIDEPPGPEPFPYDRSCWRGKRASSSAFREWLTHDFDTGIASIRKTHVVDIEKTFLLNERPCEFFGFARMEAYSGIPVGRISPGYIFALLKRFDDVNTVCGDKWTLFFKNDEPVERTAELNFQPKEKYKVGDAIPEGDILETLPFDKLTDKEIEELRLLSVEDRMTRKMRIVFRNLTLEDAFHYLAERAYFHFHWDKSLSTYMTERVVEGYFSEVEVQEILLSICTAAGLSWAVQGVPPIPENLDPRFVVNIFSVNPN